ncbi:MAG TPA: glycosyltransferase family 2 protein [Methanocorpusculum sp.]|nr:glycosyltransferase family 2 protein [Methanocorpusculum sp.]
MSPFDCTEKPLISIIIPVYNGEKYIEQTLNSLFTQTYSNFEIIISYDEKSTDNTLAILKTIEKTHPLIIDIGNDTSSGAARNRGYLHASGKYIVFTDVDDIILPEYLESMLNVYIAHPELDVVCCSVLFTDENKLERSIKKASQSKTGMHLVEKDNAIMLKIFDVLPWGPWAHMMRRTYIEQYNLRFPDCSAREDLVFTLDAFMHTEKIGCSEKIVYLYVNHAASMTSSRFDKWWEMSIPSRSALAELSKDLPREAAEEIFYRDERLVAAGCACSSDYKTYRRQLDEYNVHRLHFYCGGDSLIGKLSVIIFNISKYLYYKAMRKAKKID